MAIGKIDYEYIYNAMAADANNPIHISTWAGLLTTRMISELTLLEIKNIDTVHKAHTGTHPNSRSALLVGNALTLLINKVISVKPSYDAIKRGHQLMDEGQLDEAEKLLHTIDIEQLAAAKQKLLNIITARRKNFAEL